MKNSVIKTIFRCLMIALGLPLILLAMNLIGNLIVNAINGQSIQGDSVTNLLPTGAARDFFRYAEAAVGLIAALLVVHQLREETEAERNETLLQQSAFIKDYNMTFLSEGFTSTEKELEEYYNDNVRGERATIKIGKPGDEDRQRYINYLVYLESLATVIHNGAMTIENVDSLMGYRFFIAANNEVIQDEELIPFALHYRGIYLLYEEWVMVKYRQFYQAVRKASGSCKTDVELKNALKKIKKEPKNLEPGAIGDLADVVKARIQKSGNKSDPMLRLLSELLAGPSAPHSKNGWLGIPLFEEFSLCREKNKDKYEAVLGTKSEVPVILKALKKTEKKTGEENETPQQP